MNGIWKGTKEPLVPAKILRTTNFSKDCRIKLDDLAIIDVEKKKLDARRLLRGDIIVEKSGGGPKQPVGRVILFDMDDDDYSFCNFTSALRIKDPKIIDYKYLHKYLTYLYFEGETEKYQSNLVGFRNLDFKGYVGIEVPYPSLPEQQRIVDILDREFAKIDALKANAEKSLQAAKDLFQATLKKELEPKDGWENKQITEIASLKAGKFVSAQDIFDECKDGMYPCFGGNGLRGYVKTYNHDGRYNIIGRQGALCGNINIAEGKFHATEHAVVVSPIIPIVFKFLYYSLRNANINQYATGAAQPGISVKNINERLFLAIPSLEEQESVAARLDKVKQLTEDLQENYQKTLTLCDDLKQSLLRRAFNGEL